MSATDVTPGANGYRVWLRGRVFHEFASLTNAARCAALLEELSKLAADDVTDRVRDMFTASVREAV